jgi:hypothetical protein
MDTPPPQNKKGLGPLAWIGIGCGGIIALCILGAIVLTVFFGGSIKQWVGDAQKNPTRATASAMVKLTGGQFEMVAEDDVNKRYTVREKKSGALTTIYWSEKTKKPETVTGDFSAIPADDATPSAPAPAVPAPATEKP